LNSKNYYYSSINELGKLIRQQKVSPVAIVNTCLNRIKDLNPKLNSFITILTDQAREQAKLAEAEIKTGNWRGPLHGIPVGIKDFYNTAVLKRPLPSSILKTAYPQKMP
jgi:aspartyl-tRNA(Asn)/glutamyl-tRNA(Gln) amidotransferase subunit A